MWRLVRTLEEVEESLVYWPFTLRGSVLAVGIPIAIALLIVIIFESCQATGSCSRASWNEDVWGKPGFNYVFCETVNVNGLISQRMNTHSNLVFGVYGLIQVAIGCADYVRAKRTPSTYKRNHILEFPAYTIYYGLASCVLSAGSWLFHAHKTSITNQLDIAGIFLALPCFSLYPVAFYININSSPRVLMAARWSLLVAIAIVGITQSVYKWELSTKDVMEGHLAFFICEGVVTILLRKVPVWLQLECSLFPRDQAYWNFRVWWVCIFSGIVVVVGFVCQEAVFLKDLPCDGDSIWQFHAFWHTCVATGLFSIYTFLRSEKISYYGETDPSTGKVIGPEV